MQLYVVALKLLLLLLVIVAHDCAAYLVVVHTYPLPGTRAVTHLALREERCYIHICFLFQTLILFVFHLQQYHLLACDKVSAIAASSEPKTSQFESGYKVVKKVPNTQYHVYLSLLLRHWYEIIALYYVKSILTEISASRQDRRVLQKNKIIRIEFLSKWGMLQTFRYV